jgi:hypothetical protein
MELGFADDNAAFVPGSAQLSAYVPAGDGWTSVSLNPSVTVKLRYQR